MIHLVHEKTKNIYFDYFFYILHLLFIVLRTGQLSTNAQSVNLKVKRLSVAYYRICRGYQNNFRVYYSLDRKLKTSYLVKNLLFESRRQNNFRHSWVSWPLARLVQGAPIEEVSLRFRWTQPANTKNRNTKTERYEQELEHNVFALPPPRQLEFWIPSLLSS